MNNKVVWRSAIVEHGGLFVMTALVPKMLWWLVDNLASLVQVN